MSSRTLIFIATLVAVAGCGSAIHGRPR